MFGRVSLALITVSILAFFCAEAAEAAKGPKITNKVYFDIKHGDKELGRSAQPNVSVCLRFTLIFTQLPLVFLEKWVLSCIGHNGAKSKLRYLRLSPRLWRTSAHLPLEKPKTARNSVSVTRAPSFTELSRTSCQYSLVWVSGLA
jgi:hypothetical protein